MATGSRPQFEGGLMVPNQQAQVRRSSMLNVGFMNPAPLNEEPLADAPGEGDLSAKSSKLYAKLTGRRSSVVRRKTTVSMADQEAGEPRTALASVMDPTAADLGLQAQPPARWDAQFHRFVSVVTESAQFNGFIMLMIFFNTIVLALETSPTLQHNWELELAIVDQTLLAIYTVEAILRIYAEPRRYWLQFSNVFDFLLVAVSLCQPLIEVFVQGAGSVLVFRTFRALKALRTLRSVSFSTNLQVLVSALIDTIRRYVLSVIILLAFIMFLFGVVGYYLFGTGHEEADAGAREDWGSLSRAMLSLFTYVTADGWTGIQENIDDADTTGKWSRLYTVGFICIGHFIMTNVFIGIIIMNISEATETFRQERRRERELAVRRKKAFMMKRQREDISRMMEKQRKGNWSNFYEMVQSFQESLSHADYTTTHDMCTNPVWIQTFLETLDRQDRTLENMLHLQFELLHTLGALAGEQSK